MGQSLSGPSRLDEYKLPLSQTWGFPSFDYGGMPVVSAGSHWQC
jgi:hypothetical protein